MSSEEDYGYAESQQGSDDSEAYGYNSGSDGGDSEYGEFALSHAEISIAPRAPYAILGEEEVHERQKEAIESVTSVLGVSDEEAAVLLRYFKWNAVRVHEEWFQDEAKVRGACGIPAPPEETPAVPERLRCDICFDEFPSADMPSCRCGHRFCGACWDGYCRSASQDGPAVLSLRCPAPKCPIVVPESLTLAHLPPEARARFLDFKWRAFVDSNVRVKWCPGPGCTRAVECQPTGQAADIRCGCGATFCWLCLEEAHRPVDCETVKKWLVKNSAESENMNWILANTKPCPKCKRPIEKNQGCMHMTCQAPCRYEFCWLCLGPWKDHGERTGGFYACNRYEAARAGGEYEDSERRRESAKNSLERYMHYYERWAAHGAAHKKALEDLREMTEQRLHKLGDLQNTPASQLKFVSEAMSQISECRRILKWTYAFGFYSMTEEDAKKRFFEYTQGEAEMHLERLSEAVEGERELQRFFQGPAPAGEFNDFRGRMAGLTAVTRKFFFTLVTELEEGLPGVDGAANISRLAIGGEGGAASDGAEASGASASGAEASSAQRAAAQPQPQQGGGLRGGTGAVGRVLRAVTGGGSQRRMPEPPPPEVTARPTGGAGLGAGAGAGSGQPAPQRGAQDAGAGASGSNGNNGQWQCLACATTNAKDLKACKLCGSPQGT